MALASKCISLARPRGSCLGLHPRNGALQSILKSEWLFPTSLVIQKRCNQRPKPVINYDVEKPHFDMKKYDPEGIFSPAIARFMEARYLENDDGKEALVTKFSDGSPLG
eukprot:UN25646